MFHVNILIYGPHTVLYACGTNCQQICQSGFVIDLLLVKQHNTETILAIQWVWCDSDVNIKPDAGQPEQKGNPPSKVICQQPSDYAQQLFHCIVLESKHCNKIDHYF